MKYRIFYRFETQTTYQVVGYENSAAMAQRRADRFMSRLDPDTDSFPEMGIETVHGSR